MLPEILLVLITLLNWYSKITTLPKSIHKIYTVNSRHQRNNFKSKILFRSDDGHLPLEKPLNI